MEARRRHLAQFCQRGKSVEDFEADSLAVVPGLGVAFCPSGKTGTTAWFNWFDRMATAGKGRGKIRNRYRTDFFILFLKL